MKKFSFPLQKVLEYDTHLQKNEADALRLLQAEYRKLEMKRDQMQADYDLAKGIYQSDCVKGQSASQIKVTGMYIADQHKQIEKIGVQMKEQMRRIELQRERLVAVTQNKTMIEKLKEHAKTRYQASERKSDELFIEEFVSNQALKAGN
jgi:flagellar FliJ protein